ncbi:MAG TPA: protein kinase family protein [Pseudonocardia sp.]
MSGRGHLDELPTSTEPPVAGPSRTPGVVCGGRYRLLARVGVDAGARAEFWRARDQVLGRLVGLTLLISDTGPVSPAERLRAAEMVGASVRWERFEHIGCVRLLDAMRGGGDGELPAEVSAMAVTEWVPGSALAEAVRSGPLRTGAALAMLDPLAKAVDAAHRHGLVLGCAHPMRVRVTDDGATRLAFAMPDPSVTAAEDVRGLGAILYTLLTGHWPWPATTAELAGLPPAPRDQRQRPVSPAVLRPGLSVEVCALVMGALGAETAGSRGGVLHTASAVHRMINELLAESEAELLPPPDDGGPSAPDEVWRSDSAERDPRSRRRFSVGMAALGLGALVVTGYLGVQLAALLGVGISAPPRIVVAPSPPSAPAGAAAPAGHHQARFTGLSLAKQLTSAPIPVGTLQ